MRKKNTAAAAREPRSEEPTIREYVALVYRRRVVIGAVFLMTTGAVAAAAYLTPPVYTADTTLIVRFGREFIHRSAVAGPDSAKTFSLDEMVNSEVEILGSRDLARQVVEGVGVERLYPDLLDKGLDGDTAIAVATAQFQDHVDVTAVFESSVIRMTFDHTDAKIAAECLNVLVDRFKDKHLEVFGDSTVGFLESQLRKYEGKLTRAETALQVFKKRHKVYQIDQQEHELLRLHAQLQTELRSTEFRITEFEHQLKTIDQGLMIPMNGSIQIRFSKQREALISRRHELSTLREDTEFRITELKQKLTRLKTRTKKSSTAGALDSGAEGARSLDEALVQLFKLKVKESELLRDNSEESREVTTVREQIEYVQRFLKARGQNVVRSLKETVQTELSGLRGRRKVLSDQIDKIDVDVRTIDSDERSFYVQVIGGELSVLQLNKDALVSELARLEKELADLDSSETNLRRLEREVSVTDRSYQAFLAKFEEATIAGALDEQKIVNVRVIENAVPPVTAGGLSKSVKIAVGAAAGLLAGAVVALFLELLAR